MTTIRKKDPSVDYDVEHNPGFPEREALRKQRLAEGDIAPADESPLEELMRMGYSPEQAKRILEEGKEEMRIEKDSVTGKQTRVAVDRWTEEKERAWRKWRAIQSELGDLDKKEKEGNPALPGYLKLLEKNERKRAKLLKKAADYEPLVHGYSPGEPTSEFLNDLKEIEGSVSHGTRPETVRRTVGIILEEARRRDPALHIHKLPGANEDLFELARKLAPRVIGDMKLRTFRNYIKGRIEKNRILGLDNDASLCSFTGLGESPWSSLFPESQ